MVTWIIWITVASGVVKELNYESILTVELTRLLMCGTLKI